MKKSRFRGIGIVLGIAIGTSVGVAVNQLAVILPPGSF